MKLGAVGLAVGLAALLIAAISFTANGKNDVTTVTTSPTPQLAVTTETTVTDAVVTTTEAPAVATTTQAPAPAPVAPAKPATRPATHRAAPCQNSDNSDPTGDDDAGCSSGGNGGGADQQEPTGPDDQAGDGKSSGD